VFFDIGRKYLTEHQFTQIDSLSLIILKSKFFPVKIPFSRIQKKNLAGKNSKIGGKSIIFSSFEYNVWQ
jgi:hypothetical protein